MLNSNNDSSDNGASMDSKNRTGVSTPPERATIGPSVSVKGEISGDEDILIEGAVEGSVNLQKNSVTVAESGRVKANIYGVVIHIFGEVSGDLTGGEKIVIHKSGKVVGNISAPTISLEEGGHVKGMMETGLGSRTATTLKPSVTVETTAMREQGTAVSRALGRGTSLGSTETQNS